MSVNNSLKLFIGLFLSLFLMVACQKEELVEDSKSIFSFDSNEEFANFMDYLHQFEPEELDALPELSSFYSHRNFYDEAETLDETELKNYNYDEADEIADPYLASVLNREREILIGEIYYRLGNDNCFAFLSLENKNIIKEFEEKLQSGELNMPQEQGVGLNYKGSLLVFKTYDKLNEDSNNETADSRRSESDTENFSSKRRIKSKTWDTNWLVYQSVGTKTKMQKKSPWWVKTNARRLILRWNLSFVNANLVPSGSTQCNGSPTAIDALAVDVKSCIYCKKVEKIFDYAISFAVNSDDFTIPTTGTTLPVTPIEPSGRAIRILRHRDNSINSFTNHSGTYEGVTLTTNTLFWNRCTN